MGDLRKLVKSSVKKAFSSVGTLATPITFKLRNASEFNFSEMTSTVTDIAPVVVSALISKKEHLAYNKGQPTDTMKMQMIIMSEGLPVLDVFDTVEVAGVEWSLIRPLMDDGYITTINLAKEG